MAGEQCDDGNQVTEVCPYSQMSCVVCNAIAKELRALQPTAAMVRKMARRGLVAWMRFVMTV